MDKDEELLLLEVDDGGWTRVRRALPNPKYAENEGFVPTKWIKKI